jgi:predicted permease
VPSIPKVFTNFPRRYQLFTPLFIGNPLLPVSVIRHISRFSNLVLIPCLTVANIGASISLSLFLKVGILVPIAIATNLMSMGIGRIFKFLHEDDPKLFRASLLTIASPNTISMPILVMQSLCEQPVVNADFDDDSAVCFSQSTALLFIYSIGFHLLYWGYVFPSFEQLQREAEEEGDMEDNHSSKSSLGPKLSFSQRLMNFASLFKHILMAPTMLSVFIGLFIGLIPFTRHLLFSGSGYLSPVGAAIETLASPVVALNCLIMSASLAHVEVDFKQLFIQYWKELVFSLTSSSSPRRHSIQLSSEEEIEEQLGVGSKNISFNPMQQQRQHLTSSSSDNLNSLEIEKNSECEVRNLERILTEVIKDDGVEPSSVDTSSTILLKQNAQNLPQVRSVIFLILCRSVRVATHPDNPHPTRLSPPPPAAADRLILPPILTLLFVRLAVTHGIISPKEHLFQFLIIIVSASPSAQVIIVSLNQLGFQKLAGQIAYMYVFQYLSCILSITFVATTALRLIYS